MPFLQHHSACRQRARIALLVLLTTVWLAACSVSPIPPAATSDPTEIFQHALETAQAAYPTAAGTSTPVPTETATPLPSETATATPDPNRTPPPLPAIFQSDELNKLDSGHTYVSDVCAYLKNRWDPNNSQPGTVVMPIMFHSITDGQILYQDQISVEDFNQLMHDLKDQGFEAITTEQIIGFLYHNAKIPKRSAYLIVDDRKRFEYFETHFKPYFESFGWKVTNAWISAKDTPDYLWQENLDLEQAGYVDHQAHGVIHNINITNASSDDFIRGELFGSIEAIQQHFSKTPVVYVWPGGGFTQHAAEIAREAGYQLGFTINPRGPLMYNWVPLSDAADPGRPSYIPEGSVSDPLMVLPRYWDTDAGYHIDQARLVGKAAEADAEQTKADELEFYDIVCKPVSGPIPTQTP